jgi:HSP20 family molecular chaperone IbpA
MQPPSPLSSLEATLAQARVVTLDDYKLRQSRTDVTVVADLPGVKSSEVSFAVDPGQVTISSVVRPDTERRGSALWQLCREMRPVRSDQRLPIPRGLLVDRWTATFEDGVLRLSIPRAGRR